MLLIPEGFISLGKLSKDLERISVSKIKNLGVNFEIQEKIWDLKINSKEIHYPEMLNILEGEEVNLPFKEKLWVLEKYSTQVFHFKFLKFISFKFF